MHILNQTIIINDFFYSLKNSDQRILMLDYDGTIAPFNNNRNKAFPYEGIEHLLDKIMAADSSRVLFITGRWTKDLLNLIKLNKRPEVWGSHGRERIMPDNTYHIDKITENAIKALANVEDWMKEEELLSLCEIKPSSIALHWRGLQNNTIDDILNNINENWQLIPGSSELILAGFDGGIEAKVPGKNKGDAVKTILSESGPDSICAYLGDDVTDEDAFNALGENGLSILVRDQKRATCADIWIKPPEELVLFLNNWLAACCTK